LATTGLSSDQERTAAPVAIGGTLAEGTSIALARADHQHGGGGTSALLISGTANPAATGVVRLAKADALSFRNNANSADLALAINGSDALTFNGSAIGAGGGAPFITNTATPAAAGIVRLANVDTVNWRNNANSADRALGVNTSDQLTMGGVPIIGAGSSNGYPFLSAITTAGQSIASATLTIVIFGTVDIDTDSGYNAGTGRYTIPAGKAGHYIVSSTVAFTTFPSGTTQLSIYKNAALLRQTQMQNGNASLIVNSTLNLAAADIIDIRVNQQSGGAALLATAAGQVWLSIKQVLT
jgi:hypothetical protein